MKSKPVYFAFSEWNNPTGTGLQCMNRGKSRKSPAMQQSGAGQLSYIAAFPAAQKSPEAIASGLKDHLAGTDQSSTFTISRLL